MECRFGAIDPVEMTEGRRTLDREIPMCGSVIGGKRDRCVIFPVKSTMVAESLERGNKHWIVQTKPVYGSDLIVRVGDFSFHLHKLPMVARSKYFNRMIIQNSSHEVQDHSVSTIQIDNLPGGAMAFELVMKFCYGWKLDLTAKNVAPLDCAAHFLEMTDDLAQGNLISIVEAFLSFVISSSWKDTFKVFKSCESVSPWAKRLQIPKRCSEAIARKACMNPESFCNSDYNVDNVKLEAVVDNWWFEDVSLLRIDHFIEVIESGKQRGMKSEVIGSCVAHWTMRWLARVTNGLENLMLQHLTDKLKVVTVESLVRLLPVEENSVTSTFLFHILKLGSLMKIDSELLTRLECRLAMMLERCHVLDLLVENYGDDHGIYDVAIVTRVVKSYASHTSNNSQSNLLAVGRLVDDYLMLVANDRNLKADSFRVLAEALPQNAWVCCDNLYSATDMYLKAHPDLTEEERTCLCRSLKYRKLSQQAREHIMKNERLPLKYVTNFILLEQVSMTKPKTTFGSSYRQTKSRIVMGESKCLGTSWMMSSQKEINLMKRVVETMKVQLNDIQMCKTKLQGQVKKGFSYKKNLASVRKIVCFGFNNAKIGRFCSIGNLNASAAKKKVYPSFFLLSGLSFKTRVQEILLFIKSCRKYVHL